MRKKNQQPAKTYMGIIDRNRFKKIVLVSDNHGNMICPLTENKLFEVIESFNPEIRIHLGDFLNLNAWRDGASASEKMESLREDINSGLQFIKRFKPNVMTMGNHDYRLVKKSREGNADTREYAEEQLEKVTTLLRELKTKTFAWGVKRGVYEIAGQKMIHGYSAGITATTTMGMRYGRCVHGHNHTGDIIWLPTYDGGFAQSCPSMCDNDQMEYQLGQVASFKHVSGFALAIADCHKNLYYPGYVIKQGDRFIMMEPHPV